LAAGIKRARRRAAHRVKNAGELFGFGVDVHVRARDIRGRRAGLERFVHDLADGAGTPPALRAATEAAIHLPARDRPVLCRIDGGADIVVAEHVAGTDDHGRGKSPGWLVKRRIRDESYVCKRKTQFALILINKMILDRLN
jgi:hypothetical protein